MLLDSRPYRPNVGIALFRRDGRVLIARRIQDDGPEIILPGHEWQMPQGGIDEGEEPWATALRELQEETGIPPHLVERIAECPERLKYDLPAELQPKLWGGQWKGQLQDWYLCRFLGRDSDVNIATEHPEFRDWKWVEPRQLPELIVPFKRGLYQRLLSDFADYL